jgi:hypothetical protein
MRWDAMSKQTNRFTHPRTTRLDNRRGKVELMRCRSERVHSLPADEATAIHRASSWSSKVSKFPPLSLCLSCPFSPHHHQQIGCPPKQPASFACRHLTPSRDPRCQESRNAAAMRMGERLIPTRMLGAGESSRCMRTMWGGKGDAEKWGGEEVCR